MNQNKESIIVGISGITLKNMHYIYPKKCYIFGLKDMSIIFNNIITNIFQNFKITKQIQETTLKINEIKPFDNDFSIKLLEDGSLEVIEHS
jgi:hypothetical protein